MNRYTPVGSEHTPRGFVGNYTWEHTGGEILHGHTPPRLLPVQCPCILCAAENEPDPDRYVLGPVWISNMEFAHKIPSLIGVYDRLDL